MWSDEAQKRTLLRFRQAIANSDDTKVRIDDSADDREPRFYVRQLMADLEPQDTHEDVKAALAVTPGTDLDSPLVMFNRNDGTKAPPTLSRADADAFGQNSVAQLLSLLATSPDATDSVDVAVRQLQRNSLWLGSLMVPATPEDLKVATAELADWMNRLPEWMQRPGNGHVPSVARMGSRPSIFGWWPLAIVGGDSKRLSSPGALVLDDLQAQPEDELHTHWRRWLHIFNSFQAVQGMILTTESGIQAGDCEMLKPAAALAVPLPGVVHQGDLQEWAKLSELAADVVRPGLRVGAGLRREA